MPIRFNSILTDVGIGPSSVRLLRHQDNRSKKGFRPFDLWRLDRPGFDSYQSHQSFRNRVRLSSAPYWASFVGAPDGGTLFVGLYRANYRGILEQDVVMPHTGEVDKAGTIDVYDLARNPALDEYSDRLWIEWGDGTRAWIQRAEKRDKIIAQLKNFDEPDFPGYSAFLLSLSKIESIPLKWAAALESVRGIYLLTFPRTREQYVGKADGADGFLGRWRSYVRTGHGGNVGLKSRDPSDYEISILEVAGSADSAIEILAMEERWKQKLRSRDMGLNRN